MKYLIPLQELDLYAGNLDPNWQILRVIAHRRRLIRARRPGHRARRDLQHPDLDLVKVDWQRMVNIETSVAIFVGLTPVKDEHDHTDSMLTHSLRGVEDGKDDSANDVLQEGQTDMRRSLSSYALRHAASA
jgi:hypothetical protein